MLIKILLTLCLVAGAVNYLIQWILRMDSTLPDELSLVSVAAQIAFVFTVACTAIFAVWTYLP